MRGRELELPRGDDLEQVVGLLAGARSEDDLEAAREPVARELRADRVVLKTASDALTREVVQVLAGDPSAAPAEVARLLADGYGSLLRVPVTCEGVIQGALELYRAGEQPWSRFEISRARMIAYQLGGTLARLNASTPSTGTSTPRVRVRDD